ncbi:hypothetical protein RM553_02020 [Zunongwangia sp. F363]|uniref:Type I restriction modification DNA specificity domain-containing protein n=1 Tax=Autumnicola tepida TaxID=3075595 RepID=A0ABU3C5I9_9FLAO|nr:hypothetical protein [Zunongwangia sp. F363]MDT0641598.1 hypothetical protein [Zunongwangia sp. F363]
MVFNDELDKEIPEGWEVLPLKKLTHYSKERINIKELNLENYISTENMLPERKGITAATNLPNSKTVTKFTVGDILISNIRPYLKKIWKANFAGGCSNDIICFKLNGRINPTFLYYTLEQDIFFDYVISGSKGTKMPRGDKNWIMKYLIAIPLNDDLLNRFASKAKILSQEILIKRSENFKMEKIESIVLSKMATIEESI